MRRVIRHAKLLIILLLLLTAQASAHAQQKEAPPVFTGAQIPEPPRQNAAWTPPSTKLPEIFIDTTERLFEQGMSDPRGGEYREVEIVVGNVWGSAAVFKTHAWVLPQAGKEGGRFGVCWNGLVYPLVSTGGRANLQEDISKIAKADEEARAKWAMERPSFPFYRHANAMAEGYSTSHESLTLLKACLLLRLGEVELAEQIWATWIAGTNIKTNDNKAIPDPYMALATDWVWALFDRAVCAHMRGDDRLALLSARALVPIERVVYAEMERRNRLQPNGYQSNVFDARQGLSFLAQLPELVADQERRAKQQPQAISIKRVPRTEAIKKARTNASIEALINDLDEIAERQWGQPGGVSLGEDVTVRALIARGSEAVEPLLKVLESDTRLTRSVSFHRNFFTHRHLIGVHEAAYVALKEILQNSNFLNDTNYRDLYERGMEGRRALAGRIRQYLERYGTASTEERWYRVLADDRASAEDWLQAAANIVYLSNYEGVPPAWAFHDAPVASTRAQQGIRLRGERLRSKNAPTVTELFIRRMQALIDRKDEGKQNSWYNSLQGATNFALALLAWDGQAHLMEVRQLHQSLQKIYEATDEKDDNKRAFARSTLVSLYLKRFEVDDASAFTEYADWISEMKPEETGENTIYLFTPMWRYANHPAIARAAARMFGDASSPWIPLIDRDNRQSFYAAKLLESPMLNVQSFRERALEGLSDRTIVGTLAPHQTSAGMSYRITVDNTYMAVLIGGLNSPWGIISVPNNDERAARGGEAMNIRASDVYASRLARLSGAPRFALYWTEQERDRAIAELLSFIREHKGRFLSSSGNF